MGLTATALQSPVLRYSSGALVHCHLRLMFFALWPEILRTDIVIEELVLCSCRAQDVGDSRTTDIPNFTSQVHPSPHNLPKLYRCTWIWNTGYITITFAPLPRLVTEHLTFDTLTWWLVPIHKLVLRLSVLPLVIDNDMSSPGCHWRRETGAPHDLSKTDLPHMYKSCNRTTMVHERHHS